MIYGLALDTVLHYSSYSDRAVLRSEPSLLLMCRQVHSESKSFAAPPYTTIVINRSSFHIVSISALDIWHNRNKLSHVTSVQLGRDMVLSIEEFHKEHVDDLPAFVMHLRAMFPALELVLLPKSLEIKSDYYNATVGFLFMRPGVSIAYV
jgi:hypothetical protein